MLSLKVAIALPPSAPKRSRFPASASSPVHIRFQLAL